MRSRRSFRFSAIASLAACAFLPQPALALSTNPTPRGVQGAEADVLPGSFTPAAHDLLLPRASAARADALASFAEAIISEDNADSDKALEQYQKALALDPGYTELAVKVAFELARRGDASGGIEVLKDEIKASPKAPLPYLYLSQLYSKNLNKPEVGLKYAQQALTLDPGNLAAYLAVYEIYRTTGQPKKAAQLLEQAAAAETADPQYWLQLGDFYLKALVDAGERRAAVGRTTRQDRAGVPKGAEAGGGECGCADEGGRFLRGLAPGEGGDAALFEGAQIQPGLGRRIRT